MSHEFSYTGAMPSATRLIAETLSGPTGISPDEIEKNLEIPPDETLGEYALPCFPFAKTTKKAPAAIAQEWARNFAPSGIVAGVKSAGPYLNLSVERGRFAEAVLSEINRQGERYGGSESGRGRTAIVEYASPNIAKTFAVHHIRSTVIGNALANLHAACGWKTIRINHLGDWGTQFGTLLVAYRKWGDETLLERPDAVRVLMDLYTRFNKEKKENPALENEARAAFSALEKGEPSAHTLWNAFRQASLKEFQTIFDRLGIRFDETKGESDCASRSNELIRWLQEKGLARESEGALIVDLSDFKMPPCLLRKADESSLYATRDLITARDRHEKYCFDRMLYVVGMPQELHFRQIFKVLELAGCGWVSNCLHVPFGHYQGMRTREGTFILLAEVLDEAAKRTEVKIRDALREGLVSLPEGEIPTAAEKVGVGAVVFNDLKTRRIKDVIFDWDDLLNFQGRTGPYVQYAHARISGILRKAPAPVRTDADASALVHNAEVRLLKNLADLPRQVERAVADAEPSYVATALLDLAKAFSQFYQECPVIQADAAVQAARLRLADATRLALKSGLTLLGIQAPDKM